MLIFSLVWCSGVWGQASVKTISEDVTMNVSEGDNLVNIRNNNMKCETTISKTYYVSGTKATVTFNMPNAQKSGNNIELDGNSTYTISWAVSPNFTMKMTSFGLTGRSAAISPKMNITGGGKSTGDVGVYGIAGSWTSVTLSGINISGTSGSVTLKTNKTSAAIFYIHSFSFKYTLYHDELDLQYLDNAISAANTLNGNLNNGTLKGYLTTAVSDNKTGRSGFLFPTYIGNKTPTDVDNATNKLNAVTTFVSKLNTAWSFEQSKLPNAVYNLLHAHDVNPNEQSTANLNTWSSELQTAIDMANATTSAYQSALTTIATAKTNSENNNPANVASSDISAAESALEEAASTTEIDNALANIKNFDAVTFNSNIPSTIYTGKTYSNFASASSGRTLSYDYSVASIVSVSGTTLTAENPGTVTVTATTGSTAEGYYKCEKTQTYTVLPVFYFSADVTSSNTDLGTVSVEYGNEFVEDINVSRKEETATYTAAPKNDCVFLGWYTNSDYSGEPVSLSTIYSQTKINDAYGTTVEFTPLYALFKKKQNLQWVDDGHNISVILGTTGLSSVASITSGEGHTINYASTNEAALTIDANGAITTHSIGSGTITASVAGDNIYRAESISREFTVGEKDNPLFTPSWWDGDNQPLTTELKVGTSTTIELTNIATDATFTVSANPTGIISWTREGNTLTINGDVAGTTELTLSQTGNTFLNGNTATYTITVSRYPNTFAVAAETQAMKVGEVWENVVTNTGNNNTSVSYSTEGVVNYDATTNSITAVGEGSTTITFTQAATATHAAATKSIDVTVTKVTNTLAVSLPTQAVNVGGTIALSITGQNNADAIVGTITDTQLSSSVNNGSEVITYTNGVITACNAGKAKITFSQPATTQYTAYTSETYEITVSKLSNNISIKLDNVATSDVKLKYNSSVTLSYTRTNMDTTPIVSRSSGSATTITGNTISSSEIPGTDIYEITQAETYKYEAGYATFAVRVDNTEESVGYVLYENAKHSWGEGFNPYGSYTTDVFSGPADMLSYEAYKPGAGAGYFFVMASKDGGANYEDIDNPDLPNGNYGKLHKQLDEGVNRVQFETRFGATLAKYMNNIFVTRKTYVRASSDITNMGTLYTDQNKTATFTVKYSSTNGGNISIGSSNKNFVPSITEISVESNKTATAHNNVSYICGVDGTKTFTVTYTPDPNQLGDEPAKDEFAVITIKDKFHTQEITLTATYRKYDTTIGRGSNTATATMVDGQIPNAFAFTGTSADYPSANSSDDFYYTISHTQTSGINNGTGVISYDPVNNTITGLNAGTAQLTIYQKNTQKYHATSQSFTFSVSKLENNVDISLSANTLAVDGTATVTLSNSVSDGALSAAYSNISYLNESQNREGGLLSFAGNTLTGWNAGTGTVTITQAETYKYVAKSQSFNVTVNKLPQTLTWKNPDLETTMQVGSTLEGNTATSDVGLTPVTYSSGNTAAITVDANTGVLTAVATGSNVGITATQAGNYKYLPATLTRQFSVFNKQTPAFAADTHFEGTNGRVEYTGTATITVTGVGADSEEGFTITNGDNSIINVVRDGETITITGLQVGSTTLTLAQEGNDDFIAKSQTYNIEVYWPDDFLALSSTVEPTHTAGTYRKVFVNNTLKSGYSTIALPFDVDVEELTGRETNADDWVAQLSVVTYNDKDGYSLYFEKKNTIEANQPYILHLGTAVDSPVFTDVSVVAAEEATQNASKGVYLTDWTMHSNYSPTFDMEGKYGVVNGEGVLKKGTANSTLKAFHAYIEGPTSAEVKAAYLDEDEADGILVLFNSQENQDGDQLIYDLQGRRLPRAQAGINIVIRDGKVRKEIEPRR